MQNDINTSAIPNVKQTYILKCFAAIFMYIHDYGYTYSYKRIYVYVYNYVLVNVLYKLI